MNKLTRSKRGIKSKNDSKKAGEDAEQHEIRRAKAPKTEEKDGKEREKNHDPNVYEAAKNCI